MERKWRVAVALVISTIVFAYAYRIHQNAADFTWLLRGADDLVHGHNPYRHPGLGPGHPYPNTAVLYYPLPAVFVGLPFVLLPARLAGSLFIAASFGLLAYVLTRRSWHPLLMLASPCAYSAIFSEQISPLMVALALLPMTAGVLPLIKPTSGIPLGLVRLNRRALGVGIILFAVSMIVLPTWPFDLLHNLGKNHYYSPLFAPLGVFMLLSLAAWRTSNGRFLLLMALMPQRLNFYDQLPLLIVAQSRRQMIGLVAFGWLGWFCWHWAGGVESSSRHIDELVAPWAIISLYVPALVVVLWQARPSLSFARFRIQRNQGRPSET